MGWPSSAARRSNTSRGTTSAALPAPNGMVALISREGQPSAWAAVPAKRLAIRKYVERTCSSKTPISPPGALQEPFRGGASKYSTSVNCSSKLRWIIEKLSSETRVRTVSPSAVTWASMPSMLSISLPRSALKIAGPSIDGAGDDGCERDAPDPDADAAEPGKFSFQQQQISRWQQHGVADIEILGAADAELARRLAADQEGR